MTLLSVLWAIAFGICPQRPSHSLFLGGQQMPIEARMAGIFGGFVIGAAYFWALGRGRAMRLPGRAMTITLIGFIALMGADGINALLFDLRLPHLYIPNLLLRLGTGLLTGLAFAGFVVPAFNSTVWASGPDISPPSNAGHLLGGLLLEALYFIAAISGASIFLYPVSLMAVLEVPILLGMIGSIVIATLRVSRRENRAARATDLTPLLLGGLAAAAILLGIMSGLRYLLLGPGPLELPL
ncbi:MAG TPA: DUF2085 domain-containing protein [Anaerolineales bacterium]|nr:DUF2085 domain-containing protein [Anaerolineales bacterium]